MKNFLPKKAVILAAGESSRFWPLNAQHKSLFKIMGKPIIYYTITELERAGIKEVIIVQNEKKEIEEELKKYQIKGIKIYYVVQYEAKGMGDALFQTKKFLKEQFLLLNAERIDVKEIIESCKKNFSDFRNRGLILFGQHTDNPSLYGIMRIKGDKVLEIVEKPKNGREPSNVRVMGIYILHPEIFDYYQKIKKEHYDLEKVISFYAKEKEVKFCFFWKKEKDTPILKYPWHLFTFSRYLMNKFLKTKISKKAEISSKAIISGKVQIEDGVKIFENAVIKGNCYIGEGSIIGNNSLIREYTDLEKGVLVGANSEIKNSILQENVHCHLNFFGDSIFDKSCRIGAGTITANRRLDRQEIKVKINPLAGGQKINTSLTSLGVIMGENTSVGINVSLMPGVLIGKKSRIGPCSLVKKNIKDNFTYRQ